VRPHRQAAGVVRTRKSSAPRMLRQASSSLLRNHVERGKKNGWAGQNRGPEKITLLGDFGFSRTLLAGSSGTWRVAALSFSRSEKKSLEIVNAVGVNSALQPGRKTNRLAATSFKNRRASVEPMFCSRGPRFSTTNTPSDLALPQQMLFDFGLLSRKRTQNARLTRSCLGPPSRLET